jgi:Cdc6-like AAA superfamily ATPase
VSDAYGAWIDRSGNEKLLCTGFPGAGKTMLTSIVIADLQRRYRTYRSIGVAYIYCDYRTRDEQTVERTLQSLLKQLLEQQKPISASVQQFWQDHGYQRPLLRDISRCLQSVVASFSMVFTLIDALDECKVLDGCRTSFM